MLKLTYKQTEAFKHAISKKYSFILFGGAIRGGKSFWLFACFVYLANAYPKSRWIIARESLQTLKRTTFISWQKILDSGLRDAVVHIDNDTHTYTFKNGSQIIFMGENYDDDKELTRFAGLECNGFGADEINELQEATLDKMFERAGSWIIPNGPDPIVLATCNPSAGWVRDRVYDLYVKDKMPSNWLYIPAKITDNPHVPQAYLESLKQNLTPIKYRRFVEGDWYAHEVRNAFATHYDPEKHDAIDILHDESLPLYMSIDFNLNPLGMIFFHIYSDEKGDHFHVFDEITVDGASIPKVIEEVKRKYGPYLSDAKLTGDAMGNRQSIEQSDNADLFEQLRRGFGMRRTQVNVEPNPTHIVSRSHCNYILYHFPDFKLNPNTCKNLKRDLMNVQCDASGSIIKANRKDLDQRADHLDCFRSAVNSYLKKWIEKHKKISFSKFDQAELDKSIYL